MAGWLAPRLTALGLRDVQVEAQAEETALLPTEPLIERWLGPEADYARGMADRLDPDDLRLLRERLTGLLGGPARPWRLVTAFVRAHAGDVGGSAGPGGGLDRAT